MKVSKEERQFLKKELKEYEKITPMTDAERKVLHEKEEWRKKANRLYRTCFLYWEVLVANDLRDEAYEYVREHIDEEWPFDSFDWDITP